MQFTSLAVQKQDTSIIYVNCGRKKCFCVTFLPQHIFQQRKIELLISNLLLEKNQVKYIRYWSLQNKLSFHSCCLKLVFASSSQLLFMIVHEMTMEHSCFQGIVILIWCDTDVKYLPKLNGIGLQWISIYMWNYSRPTYNSLKFFSFFLMKKWPLESQNLETFCRMSWLNFLLQRLMPYVTRIHINSLCQKT